MRIRLVYFLLAPFFTFFSLLLLSLCTLLLLVILSVLIIERFSSESQQVTSLTQLCHTTSLKETRSFLPANQKYIQTKRDPLVYVSRALRQLHVLTIVIGLNEHNGFSFTTLNWKRSVVSGTKMIVKIYIGARKFHLTHFNSSQQRNPSIAQLVERRTVEIELASLCRWFKSGSKDS